MLVCYSTHLCLRLMLTPARPYFALQLEYKAGLSLHHSLLPLEITVDHPTFRSHNLGCHNPIRLCALSCKHLYPPKLELEINNTI